MLSILSFVYFSVANLQQYFLTHCLCIALAEDRKVIVKFKTFLT
uniref:Uncharacterized protein n=1 Tax=Arundo donax TaxID=35708 RepID=A0A0A8YKP2_ARUDO